MKNIKKLLCIAVSAAVIAGAAIVPASAVPAIAVAALPAPRYVNAKTESATSIYVSWAKVDGAEKYNVYEWVSDNPADDDAKGKYVLIRTVTKPNPEEKGKHYKDYLISITGIKDTKQTAHVYKVAAVDVTNGKTTVGVLSDYVSAYTATAGKVTLDDVKGRFVNGIGAYHNRIQLDPGTKEIWYEQSNFSDSWYKYAYGKYTAAIKSDTEVELNVKDWDFESMRIVFDKSSNTLSVWTGSGGAFDDPFILKTDLPTAVIIE